MVFCQYVAIFTSDGFIQMLEGNVPALQSASALPFLFYWGLYGKAICGVCEIAAQLPAPLRQQLTAETSEQAGGQDSPLSDGCFLLAFIDQKQSPPTVCHILTKWITDKSAGANCPTDLTTSLRPRCSQVTSACLCSTNKEITLNMIFYEMHNAKKKKKRLIRGNLLR